MLPLIGTRAALVHTPQSWLFHMKSLLLLWAWWVSATIASVVPVHLDTDPGSPFPCRATVSQTAQPYVCMPGGQTDSKAPVPPTTHHASWPEPAECHLPCLLCSWAYCFMFFMHWVYSQNTREREKPRLAGGLPCKALVVRACGLEFDSQASTKKAGCDGQMVTGEPWGLLARLAS